MISLWNRLWKTLWNRVWNSLWNGLDINYNKSFLTVNKFMLFLDYLLPKWRGNIWTKLFIQLKNIAHYAINNKRNLILAIVVNEFIIFLTIFNIIFIYIPIKFYAFFALKCMRIFQKNEKFLTLFQKFMLLMVVWLYLFYIKKIFKKYFGFCININNNFCLYMKNCLWVLVLIFIFLCKSQLYSLWFLWAGQFC